MAQSNSLQSAQAAVPHIRTVSVREPFAWIARGLKDLRAAPMASLFYGMCLASMGFLLFFYARQDVKYIAALTSGFLLAGPFVAIGLYDISRRHERGETVDLGRTSIAWHDNANSIAVFALLLGAVMLAWTVVALAIFGAFYGDESPTLQQFVADALALRHLDFFVTYTVVGGLFALLVFALSVVSIPMMLDRNCDALTAMRTSLQATMRNLPAMLVWGLLISILTLLGLWSLNLGLIVTMPIVGHASWHAYRALVGDAR